uniref:Transient-receptor-potential-like protein n=1 Tax=Cacopsylla melanoneura TaxID=428564 RepID=A0A8D8ZKX2_9HEMI
MDEKVHFGGVGVEIEGPGIVHNQPFDMPNLPKPLTLEEKKYLLSVERGDTATVRKCIKRAYRNQHIDINCADPLGRSALTLAIEGENLEMTELLIVMGVEPKDALLQAINSEFVEAVELLLEYEEIVHKDGEPYSWEKVDKNTSMFTKDITPLILAAHKNNYEILKILLDRGATLPMPHDVRCGCDVCLRETEEDSLRHSMSRVNEYRALASPSLIALSSNDPILTAFQLSWELRNLAFTEPECRNEYLVSENIDTLLGLASESEKSRIRGIPTPLKEKINSDVRFTKEDEAEFEVHLKGKLKDQFNIRNWFNLIR